MSEKIMESGIQGKNPYVTVSQKNMRFMFLLINNELYYVDSFGRKWRYINEERNGSQYISIFESEDKQSVGRKRMLKFATTIFEDVKRKLNHSFIA